MYTYVYKYFTIVFSVSLHYMHFVYLQFLGNFSKMHKNPQERY